MNSSNIDIEKIETLIYQGTYGSLNVELLTKHLKVISGNYINMNFTEISEEANVNSLP